MFELKKEKFLAALFILTVISTILSVDLGKILMKLLPSSI